MKPLLLDTHVLLWWLKNDNRLKKGAVRDSIADEELLVYVSAVSTWEIAIKSSLGKLEAPKGIEKIVRDKGFDPLPVSLIHGEIAGQLPSHHNDPFDRMLIAQAQAEDLTILTHDSAFKLYKVDVMWIQ